jgi:hypothetical protein
VGWERWCLGTLVLAAAILPAFVCAPWLRRRVVPGWSGLPARLADALIAIAGIVLTAELLGTLHLLRPGGLVVGGLLLGLALRLAGRPGGDEPGGGDLGMGGRAEVGMAVVAATALAAQTLTGVVHRGSRGIFDPDSLHYHLTFAARFATSGSTTGIPYVSAGDNAPYHPATAELLHALGMVAWRVDALSLILNLGAIVLALLAAAALGATRGRGAASLTAVAAMLALPMIGRDHGGSAHNDILAIAFLLAGVALAAWALRDGGGRGGLVLAGAALGLAVGTKLSVAGAVALVTVAVSADARSWRAAAERLRVLVPAALATGGYWFARNLLHTGNPVPAMDVGFLPRPPMPVLDSVDQSVLHYLGDGAVISDVLLPGLRHAIGAGLPLVAVLVVAAAVLAARDGRLRRLLAGAMVLALVLYLVTPTTAGGGEGEATLFRFNVRYAAPALCVLVALPGRWTAAWLVALLVTLTGDRAWAEPADRMEGIAAAAVLAGVVLAARRLPGRAVAVAALLLVLVGGGIVTDRYVDRWRYASPETDRDRLVALGRDLEEGRTGVSGLPLQYSFFGPRLRARADYVAEVTAEDEVRDPPTCAAWRRALRAGRYDRVVVFRRGEAPIPETAAWTASIPGVRTTVANGAGAAFELPVVVPDDGC